MMMVILRATFIFGDACHPAFIYDKVGVRMCSIIRIVRIDQPPRRETAAATNERIAAQFELQFWQSVFHLKQLVGNESDMILAEVQLMQIWR